MGVMSISTSYLSLRDQSAFTLLEVLIAVSIIGISLTTLFSSQSQSLSLALESKFNTTVSMLANLKLAEIESAEELFDDEGGFGEQFPDFTYKIEINDVDVMESELLEELQKTLQRVDLTISMGDSGVYSYQVSLYKRFKENR